MFVVPYHLDQDVPQLGFECVGGHESLELIQEVSVEGVDGLQDGEQALAVLLLRIAVRPERLHGPPHSLALASRLRFVFQSLGLPRGYLLLEGTHVDLDEGGEGAQVGALGGQELVGRLAAQLFRCKHDEEDEMRWPHHMAGSPMPVVGDSTR